MHRHTFLSAFPLMLFTLTAGTAMAQSIEGTAACRERMSLPATAVFEASIEDVSRADAPTETVAVTRELLFTTDAAAPVITGGRPTRVSLMLRRAAGDQTPPPAAGGNRRLEGTYWRATELAGKPVAKQEPTREAHLQFQAGRVSGSDGCNRVAGSYQLNGDRVTFSQVAVTQMACLNSSGTEGPFQDALKNASRLIVTGDRLELFDSAGTRLATFVAGSQPSTQTRQR